MDVSDCTPNSIVGEGQGTEEKEYSAMLHKALEGAVLLHTFPKTTVDVFALILQSGGCESSTAPTNFFNSTTLNKPEPEPRLSTDFVIL